MKLRCSLGLPGSALLLVAALAFHLSKGLRMARVDHPDENWTLAAIHSSFDQIVIFVLKEDNHPPLYYLVAKAWSLLVGLSIPQVRLLSYGFALLTVACFVVFHARYRLISLFVPLLLLGTNPLFTYYAATIRPYAMMVALASIVTLSALLLRERSSTSSLLEVQGDLPMIRGIFYGTGLLLGLTHYYGTLYVAILLAIDAVERRISRSRLPGIGLFSLLLVWPLLQKLFGSLEKQAESNQWVEVFPFISTFNNFLMGNFPVVLVSRQPAYLFACFVFAALIVAALRSPQNHRTGAAQSTQPRFRALSWRRPESPAITLVQAFRKLLTKRSFYLSLIVGLVYLFSTLVDFAIPFSTPYYFLVCLPASVLLFDALCQAIERRLGIWPAIFVTAGVVICQLILSQQRLALP
jgi:hypothetical protein